MRQLTRTAFLYFLFAGFSMAQTGSITSPSGVSVEPPSNAAASLSTGTIATIPLIVTKGTPLQILLDKEIRVREIGEPVHGRIVQPVYAVDREVIAAGTEVTGKITTIERISGKKRTLSILNADFTPARKIDIEFNELIFANGKRIPLHTIVMPGSGQVIQLVGTGDTAKKNPGKSELSEKLKEAKQQAKQEWQSAMKQVKKPHKVHTIERYAVGQLPAHPQYIDVGTLYFAELQDPLDFDTEPFTPEIAASMKVPPPPDSVVHARLLTPLNSSTTSKGEEVEAVITQPLFTPDHRLIFLEGSFLKGSVLQVHPARRMHHNGQLRIAFHEVIAPDGIEQRVDANLEGVQANRADHVKLDTEGGAQATSPKTRYLTTAISVGLAAMSFGSDSDANKLGGDAGGDAGSRAAGGLGGFKLPGMLLGAFVHSQPLGMGLGAYGASMSVYSHFFSRGRDIVFAKNTAMDIGIRSRTEPVLKPYLGFSSRPALQLMEDESSMKINETVP